MIETKGLTKFYGSQAVLSDVSFKAEKGEILGFLGPNGAGKTTTMRILTCFLAPTRGSATVAGFDVQENSIEIRRRTGYLPENVPLYEDMPVWRYLDFVGDVKDLSRSQRGKQIGEVLDSCGLGSVQKRIIGNLSKGYKQRVGLAQALLGDPQVLILDEPTVGLDPRQIIEIRNLIKSLAGERTVILSTHILPEVEMICSRVVIINEGKVIAQDTPRNLTHRLQGGARIQVTLRCDSNEKPVAVLRKISGVKRVEPQKTEEAGCRQFLIECNTEKELRDRIAAAMVESGLALVDLRNQDLTLEQIFIQTIAKEEVAANA